MNILLDTQLALFALADRLSGAVKTRIVEAPQVYVSAASLWEIAIKHALGRLDVDLARLPATFAATGFRELPLTWLDAITVRTLPPIHKDPFDRALVAQAMTNRLHLMTTDKRLAGYSDLVEVV
jgi:PIN domain nuclease of toxin-antitoxin system